MTDEGRSRWARLRLRNLRERDRAVLFGGTWFLALVLLWNAMGAVFPPPVAPPPDAVHATLIMEGPSWTITYEANTRNNTVFAFMREASVRLGFPLDWVDYGPPYVDVFITAINGTRNDGTRQLWWQYCLNGEYADLGAMHQAIWPGDVVRWVYAPEGGDELCE